MRTGLLAALVAVLPVSATANETFVGPLRWAEQVPPVETLASGNTIVKFRGGELSYRLIVANLHNIVASHIHCAPMGVNDPIGITLFLSAPVAVNGILAQGPILAPDAGNACGWMTVDDVVTAIVGGEAYVNVHTLQNLPGEIRGQLR